MSNPKHDLFLWLYDYQWEALSAIGTLGATIAALSVPFLMHRLEGRRAKQAEDRDRQNLAHDATSAVFNALRLFNEAKGHATDRARLAHSASAAEAMVTVLDLLAARQNLGDNSIFACANARIAMTKIIVGRELVHTNRTNDAGPTIEEGQSAAYEANEKAKAIRANLKIPEPTDGYPVVQRPEHDARN